MSDSDTQGKGTGISGHHTGASPEDDVVQAEDTQLCFLHDIADTIPSCRAASSVLTSVLAISRAPFHDSYPRHLGHQLPASLRALAKP